MSTPTTFRHFELIIEKAFAAGFAARGEYIGAGDAPPPDQDFMDWCNQESERLHIHQGGVPLGGWIKEVKSS